MRRSSTYLIVSILFCLLTSATCLSAQAQTTVNSSYDHGLRHFYWLYTPDPIGHQRRDWYQESPSTWNEIYEDGRYNHSRIVDANAIVDGNLGIICVGDKSTLRLFIPNADAKGTNPKRLRFQQPGAASWTLFAPLSEVIQPTPHIAVGANLVPRPQSASAAYSQQPDAANWALIAPFEASQPAPHLAVNANVVPAPQSASAAHPHSKIDADESDVAAMAQKIALAHSTKIPELESNHGSPKVSGWQKKACRTGVNVHDIDPAGGCTGAAREITNDSASEQILLKGCSYEKEPFSLKYYSPCRDLGELYLKELRFLEVIALYGTTYAKGEGFNSVQGGNSLVRAYRALGNRDMVISELSTLCYAEDEARYCRQLKTMGVDVDMQDARERQRDRERTEDAQAAERAAMDAKMNEHIRQVHADTMEVLSQTIDKTMGSIQQSQANTAQARVNVAAAKMAQQNRGAGGYPTTSSSGSSGSGSSSTTAAKQISKKADTAAPDTDSFSDADAPAAQAVPNSASGAVPAFNGYSPQPSGYNPYGAKGIPPVDSPIPGEKGHWAESELVVTCQSNFFPRTIIAAVLVKGPGDPDCHGPFVEFSNLGGTHPFYYGFAGVINERFEANTKKLINWGAPYRPGIKNGPDDPGFSVRVSIRYFATE